MNDICLVLRQSGDSLGELPVDTLRIGMTETSAGRYEVPAEEVGCIYDRLNDALANEGFETAVDEIDFKLAVSRALLQSPPDGTIKIQLDVRPSNSATTKPLPDRQVDVADLGVASDGAADVGVADLNFDDLFDVAPIMGSFDEGGNQHV